MIKEVCVENFTNVPLMIERGAVSKLVDLKTGKITRFVNPKYPKEYMESGERIILGKQKLFHIF